MPKVLLTHDGELSDVRSLLDELGAEFEERVGNLSEADKQTNWKVIVGSPRRVLDLQIGASGEKPTRIAVLEGDSKTLLSMLRRSGVDIMVQRPVHPAALRLLILHALYQGPEKRRHQRYTIGAPIRFRAGLMKKPAILADLSLRGCRLISPISANKDASIKLFFGNDLGSPKAFAMRAKVIRSGPTLGTGDNLFATALAFDEVSRDEVHYLKNILKAHVSGPAMMAAAEAAKHTVAHASTRVAAVAAVATPPTSPEPEAVIEEKQDRRVEPRHALDRRIIALGVEATRVLIGRDISVAGMRIETNDTLSVQDELRIALHVRARAEPLVLRARVERDDGDDGMLLAFHDLTEQAETYLRKMVHILPILAARGGDEGSGVVVSEILERTDPVAAGVAASPA